MENFQEIVSTVQNKGISVYPVYFNKDTYLDGKKYSGLSWYIRVDMPTRTITYNKPVATGNVLDSRKHPEYVEAMEKTYVHLFKEIHQKNKK
jgi:thiamine biosynthesis lipoprotein ApbE